MKAMENIGLKEVQVVYSGPEGVLWELIMGEQIHIGGFASSTELAEKAGIGSGLKGVDLCCCNGAGMRFLVRFRDVAGMVGVCLLYTSPSPRDLSTYRMPSSA